MSLRHQPFAANSDVTVSPAAAQSGPAGHLAHCMFSSSVVAKYATSQLHDTRDSVS